MIRYSKIKVFFRLLVCGFLFPFFVFFSLAIFSNLGIGVKVFGFLSIFLAVCAFYQMLAGIKSLFGRRVLLEIQGNTIIFYNHDINFKFWRNGIVIPMEEIKEISRSEIEVFSQTFGKQAGLVEGIGNFIKPKSSLSSSKIESIRLVFFKDVLDHIRCGKIIFGIIGRP